MNTIPDLSSADLAALLSSKICHDIISPVFGIQSGLELLDDMPDDAESMGLVRNSCKAAVGKLQFARMAYGASGSQAATIDLNDARTVADGYMAHEKPDLVWSGKPGYVPKNFVKAILNLVVLASSSISRGGEVKVEIESADPCRASVTATGQRIRLQPDVVALIDGSFQGEAITAQTIQPYYMLFLANEAGLTVSHEIGEGVVKFTIG
ncbi:histidine phosphotransferase family protein [Fulvimarina sp. 2208YS6-2-32]|uniref:Histidine phosphotransferase family protein n=1 Tax=Fulvimarina uroteuthidis TaxID=3098149 RepID=A0ABU5I3R9_9HYPH|nr:histidine phosphotransferase family protein [Fulvimarina sp. 2208YS6-2-32]MDY8109418.1 histidine phosphotransferase family protein [Fulvimarina sp. 2208YS6-2-32]